MRSLGPGYGETPLDPDEADALTPAARLLLGDDPTRADIYDAEQAISDDVSLAALTRVAAGQVTLSELLTDEYLRALHRELYADIWTWGGLYRRTEKSVGIDPIHIMVEVRQSLDTIKYRWEHTDDWDARQLGIAVHAELVRIHPFVDGNGRTTRLLANLVYVAAQESPENVMVYDWALDKRPYVDLLREYDVTRDASDLAAFVPITSIE